MKMILVDLGLSLLLLVPFAGFSQGEVKLSLDQAKELALKNNYDLKNSALDIEKAHEVVKENTAIGLPQVNGGVDYLDYLDRPTSLLPGEIIGMPPGSYMKIQFGLKYNSTLKLSASQLIFSGQYLVGLQAAKAYLDLTRDKIKKDQQDVTDLVENSYIGALVLEENIRVLDSTLKTMNQMLFEIREVYKNGMVEDIDVNQVELYVSNLEATLSSMNAQKSIAYNYLKYLMGIQKEKQLTLTDDLDHFKAGIDVELLSNRPFDRNQFIDYILFKKQEKLTFLQYKLAKTAYMPTLTAFMGFQENAQRTDWDFFQKNEPWFKTWNWGLSLNIPIWSSGTRMHKLNQARIDVEKTKVTDEKLKSLLDVQVETARKDLNSSYLVYTNKQKGLDLSETIYNKTMIKYRQGVTTSMDLDQKYNQYMQTQAEYFSSLFDLLKNSISLEKLLKQY